MRVDLLQCMVLSSLLLSTSVAVGGETSKASTRVITYPAPQGAELSDEYTVTVNGRPVDVYSAPVWDPTSIYPNVPSFGGPYSFAYFDIGGAVDVSVTTRKPLDKVRILPESRGIRPKVKGDKVTFKLTRPCNLSVEPAGKNGPLLLFANPLEVNAPKQGDPGVRYFGPGIHEAGEIKLSSNETLYVAGGAVVRGGVYVQGSNVRIAGRGIIDGGKWERFKGPSINLLSALDSSGLKVEGIILKDSWSWTCVLRGCENVSVDNLKICSSRCENNDGIDLCNSRHVKITNCFLRTDDDCIAPKGFGHGDGMPVEDVTVTKCVLWTDRAHIWRLGCESRAKAMRDMLFKDIDVLHFAGYGPWMISVQPAEDMPMENVRFEDIRVNGEGQERLIELMTEPTQWAEKQTPGTIRNCLFKHITVSGVPGGHLGRISVRGAGAEGMVEGVKFENVVRYGQRVSEGAPELEVNQFAKDVSFR